MSNGAPLPAFGALAGLKVIDLSRVLGGPYCGQMLADHGAQVIKVEPPTGDETRAWGPPFADDGTAAYYNGLNRNKRDIVIDLSRPEGREIVLKLLADADVLIENFKIGTLERWGIGYEQTLRERFPRLIHCRVSGFGADGPLGGAPGYDAVAQALGGLMSVNGTPDTGPLRVGVPVVDITTGLSAVIGVLLAVIERQRSGRGQFVEATLYDTAVSLLHPQSANWLQSGQTPQAQRQCALQHRALRQVSDPDLRGLPGHRQQRTVEKTVRVPRPSRHGQRAALCHQRRPFSPPRRTARLAGGAFARGGWRTAVPRPAGRWHSGRRRQGHSAGVDRPPTPCTGTWWCRRRVCLASASRSSCHAHRGAPTARRRASASTHASCSLSTATTPPPLMP